MENKIVFKDKELKDCDNKVLGVSGENKQQVLVFKIEEGFIDGKASLDLILPNDSCCDRKKYNIELKKDIENECYKLEVKRSLLRYDGDVKMQLKIISNGVEIYKTAIFEMHVMEAINAVESIEEDYPDLVTELEIRMNDLEDGMEQINERIDNIKVPNKISDLENDSNFVDDESYVHTDNNFTTADKEKLDGLKEFNDEEIKEELGKKTTLEEVKTVINSRINELVAGAPETFDTLKEIADYIAEHEEIAKALNDAIGNKANKEEIENLASKAYVDSKIGDIDTLLASIAIESEAI